jgi:hypothetical protein
MLAVNLMGCHHINSVYLCKQHRVLKWDFNSTCLGYHYMQDFKRAMTLCEMEVMLQAETILQLHDYWYLVHSPKPLTSYTTYLNDSSSETFIKLGANWIYISLTCRLQLHEHVLISDFSVCLDAVIKHYEWELEQIAFSRKRGPLS